MAKSYLDKDGLLYFWQKIKGAFVTDVTWDSTNKKIQKTKNGSSSDVVTLATVATSGSYNDLSNKPTIPTLKNVFGKVKVGTTTVEADTTQDTLELVAGSNITLTPDATNDAVTIAATDTTYSEATTSAAGLMSSSDKTKLNGIATGAEVNQNAFSNVKVGSTTVAADAKTDTFELVAGSNVTLTPDATNDKVTIAATDTTYSAATTSANGLMSSEDKVYLDAIKAGGSDAGKVWMTTSPATASTDAVTQWSSLATVAMSGSYNDLSNKPTIPTLKNVFGKVKVGSTTVEADTTQDTLELVAGSNVTLTPDATNDKVTIAATDTTYSQATDAALGLVKLYNTTGNSTDGTMTRGAITSELGNKINSSAIGAASGVCPLNASSKIDSTYLPSYVDDVIEAYARSGQTALSSTWLATGSASGTVITPETGKIYILMADTTDYAANTQFRWSGTTYVKMADGGVSSITNAEIDTIVAS